jgi:VanZ family protein
VLPLRYTRWWQIAGALVLLLVFAATIAPALVQWPRINVRTLFAFDKWLHGLTFLILSLWFSGQYARRAYWRIGVGLLVFGGFIELCQRSLTYRTADPADMLANMIGIALGLLLATAGLGGWSLRLESWLAAHWRRD